MTAVFRGRLALVTGAASGIGAALAEALAGAGARVWLTDVDADAVAETAAAIGRRHPGAAVHHAPLDVTDGPAFAAAVARVGAPVDFLFNNAGVGLAGELRDLTPDDWRRVLAVNLEGTINGVHAVYPAMVERGSGHIVNIASGAALAPRPGMVPYAAAKAAVVGLSRSLRAEAAGLGVRVSAVCPGYIDTGIMDRTRFVGLDRDGLAGAIPIAPISAAECARRTLRGVARNRGLIPVGAEVGLEWRLMRFAPGLVERMARWRARQFRAHRTAR